MPSISNVSSLQSKYTIDARIFQELNMMHLMNLRNWHALWQQLTLGGRHMESGEIHSSWLPQHMMPPKVVSVPQHSTYGRWLPGIQFSVCWESAEPGLRLGTLVSGKSCSYKGSNWAWCCWCWMDMNLQMWYFTICCGLELPVTNWVAKRRLPFELSLFELSWCDGHPFT